MLEWQRGHEDASIMEGGRWNRGRSTSPRGHVITRLVSRVEHRSRETHRRRTHHYTFTMLEALETFPAEKRTKGIQVIMIRMTMTRLQLVMGTGNLQVSSCLPLPLPHTNPHPSQG